MKFDAVVVGSGPAGATCARLLASNGFKVAILERRKLPRFKLCGGCISARCELLLPEGWHKSIKNTLYGGLLGFKGKDFFEARSDREVAYIVDRAEFDHFLTQEAQRQGSFLFEETKVLGFEEGKTIKVFTNRGTFETDFLIGADGVYSKVAKILGFHRRVFFRSLEFWTRGKDLGDKVVIDIGFVKRGYCWVFPKGELLSVGLASTGKENLLEVLKGYSTGHPFVENAPAGVKGWLIPFTAKVEDLHLGKGRIFLVGDAAGMVDPLLGEGIFYAIKGAHLLAKALLAERPMQTYRRLVYSQILPEFIYAGRIADLAYSFQKVAHSMGGGYALKVFLNLLSGKETYKGLYYKGFPSFVGHFFLDRLKNLTSPLKASMER